MEPEPSPDRISDLYHYHQALALVVAETFEQARAAAGLVRLRYATQQGAYDLAAAKKAGTNFQKTDPYSRVGDFEKAFGPCTCQWWIASSHFS